jgi:hypothetical protein
MKSISLVCPGTTVILLNFEQSINLQILKKFTQLVARKLIRELIFYRR